jgi:tripartite-type tricarboxylate transporter receptor subunit TctC
MQSGKTHAINPLAIRCLLAVSLACLLIAVGAHPAWTQNKTIRIIVPYTPGSGPDIISRIVSDEVGNEHGPTMVVENHPGAGTIVGTEVVQRADPDGATLLLVASSFVINPALKRGNYDIAKDFTPVCYLASTPMLLVVHGSSPYKTLADLIAGARANPGKFAFASGGPGSSLHIAIEVLRRAAKIDISYVPYGGTAPAIDALLGGHFTAVWADYPTVVSLLQAGTLRGLVTTSHVRVPTLPDVPTFTETGVANYDVDIFYGVVAPAKTPPDTIAALSKTISAALKSFGMDAKLAKVGLFPAGICGSEFGAYMQKLGDDYVRIISEANITVN